MRTHISMSYAEEKRSDAWSEQCTRKYQFKNASRMVKHLVLFLNVGRRDVAKRKRPEFKTYISYDTNESGKLFRACQYAVVVHNFETGVTMDGDSCAWAKPSNLDGNISKLLFHLTNLKSAVKIQYCHYPDNRSSWASMHCEPLLSMLPFSNMQQYRWRKCYYNCRTGCF